MDFSERTDTLAARLGCDIGDLSAEIGIGRSTLFGYRSGKLQPSKKAWAKLEAAEREAGIGATAVEEEPVPDQISEGVDGLDQTAREILLDAASRSPAALEAALLGVMEFQLLDWVTRADLALGTALDELAGTTPEEDQADADETLARVPELKAQAGEVKTTLQELFALLRDGKVTPDLPDDGNVVSFPAPFYGAVAAGEPVEAPLDDEVMIDEKCPPGHFVVEVNGVSMEPTLMDGDRILCDGRDKFAPKDGAICIVSDGSGSSVKRWNRRKNAFESDNPDYPDLTPDDGLRLQGYFVKKVTVNQ